jgi:hypothetical protein
MRSVISVRHVEKENVMPRTILFGMALVLIAGCATTKTDEAHPVYVGHGTDGELVMASTHYQSMTGFALASTDLKATGRKEVDMVCKREMLTGTHLPEWICRYQADVEQDRDATQRMLLKIPTTCMSYDCAGD